MGPLIIDIESYELDSVEREKLQHPMVGGLILFSRNYAELAQLKALVKDIRKTVNKPFLITVDHEGGRVQRFIQQFTKIPSMSFIKTQGDSSSRLALAQAMGHVMAAELLLCDIDLSFAPVLDLDRGSKVIGERAFSHQADEAIKLATAYIDGMHDAGMKATGKHFPGHGSVLEDSHVAMPNDTRSFDEIATLDMSIFTHLIKNNKLHGIMPAHVIYSVVDKHPAGFSTFWLQTILRQTLGFEGVIFSDDLSMQAATAIENVVDRAHTAIDAGCDMILVCNSPNQAEQVIDGLPFSYHSHAARAKQFLITEPLTHRLNSAEFLQALKLQQQIIRHCCL